MNELLDRFCESPRRWLIVTGVTIVLALLIVLPQVDVYTAMRDEGERLRGELVESQRVAAELPAFEQRVQDGRKALDALEARTVNEETLAAFRNELVERVRQSGCQVRRINVGTTQGRPWVKQDNPLNESAPAGEPTPFVLEARPVSLTVAGNLSQVRALLGSMASDGKMAVLRSLDLRPAGANRKGVQVDLEVVYFALALPKPAA